MNKKKDLLDKLPIDKLPVGKFANINGSIVYRYAPVTSKNFWYDLTGCWMIEKHNHKQLNEWWIDLGDQSESRRATYSYVIELIEKPQKKHIDNAIATLKDSSKKGLIDGLCYIENINTLKELLRAYGKKKD